MPTCRIYLARHGRTALNAANRLRGLSDPPLDPIGLAEVARLGAALADKGLSVVVCSPLQRAVSTAQAIADAAGVEVQVDKRLVDRDYGPQTGESRDEVIARYGSVDAAPGVEPLAALTARALQAFNEIATELGPDPVAMVSHDAFNSALLAALDPTLGQVRQRTACWNQLSLVDAVWRVDSVDNVADDPAAV